MGYFFSLLRNILSSLSGDGYSCSFSSTSDLASFLSAIFWALSSGALSDDLLSTMTRACCSFLLSVSIISLNSLTFISNYYFLASNSRICSWLNLLRENISSYKRFFFSSGLLLKVKSYKNCCFDRSITEYTLAINYFATFAFFFLVFSMLARISYCLCFSGDLYLDFSMDC